MGARLSKDDYFLLMARFAGLRGTCVRRTVGCILVDEDYQVLSTGYNGVPAGEPHCIDHPCEGANDPHGDCVRCRAVHAEHNAIEQARSRDLLRLVRRAYVSATPCLDCAERMVLWLPRLIEVRALAWYTSEGVRELQRHHIVVTVHPTLRKVSLDLLLKMGERWR